MGDFNVNILLDHNQTVQFKLLFQRFGLSNLIHETINFTIHQGSCRDFIITNDSSIVQYDSFVNPPCCITHSITGMEVRFHVMKQYDNQRGIKDFHDTNYVGLSNKVGGRGFWCWKYYWNKFTNYKSSSIFLPKLYHSSLGQRIHEQHSSCSALFILFYTMYIKVRVLSTTLH